MADKKISALVSLAGVDLSDADLIPVVDVSTAEAKAVSISGIKAAFAATFSSQAQTEIYTTEALGRAAVADGQEFKVQGSGDVAAYEYRRTDASTSVLIATYPSVGAVTQAMPLLKSIATNGKLDPAGAAIPWALGTPSVASVTETYLNSIGINYAMTMSTLGSAQESYFKVSPPVAHPYTLNSWACASVYVYADDWTWLGASQVRLLIYRKTSGSAQVVDLLNSYQTISANVRRFFAVAQMTALSTDLDYMLIQVKAGAGRTAVVRASGYAGAFSEQKPAGVEWLDFDPYSVYANSARIASLETRLPAATAAPGLLLPSSLYLVKGRALELYRDTLQENRDSGQYDIAAYGANGTRPSVEYADRILRLDGNRFSGAGNIFAKQKGTNTSNIWRKPVTFNASNATKTGSPKILMIGDSLTQQGTVGALSAKLTEAGVTPIFLGTKKEQGGNMAEGRSSWSTQNFLNIIRAINTNGTSPMNVIRTGAGSGVTFTATVSGGMITGVTASGGTGYDDVPSIPLVLAGGGNNAQVTCAISGGVPGACTVVSAGTGYASAPTVNMPPTVAEYLALTETDYATNELGNRWTYNPFLRPSTGGDDSGVIHNGYVFDMGFYLARFSFANPDIVTIALGTNDILKYSSGSALSGVTAALPEMYANIRAALPSAKVAFVINMFANTLPGDTVITITKELLRLFSGREGENISVLPVFACVDSKFVYGVTVTATDSQTGVQTCTLGNNTHPDEIGRSQWAEMIFAYVMNKI